METIVIREKTTSDIDMQLKADGSAISLTGIHHVEMHMIDTMGKVYRYLSTDSPAYVSIVSASGGSVRFTPPDATIFQYLRSPYKLYWLIYEDATKKYAVPESMEEEAKIELTKEY